MNTKKWFVKKTNKEFLDYIAHKASISKLLAQILVSRGIKTPDDIKVFLSPKREQLHDPFMLPDMEKAVERIKKAARDRETVLIFGDYDADGITSTSILLEVLTSLGINVIFYIPDRIAEGYGFNCDGVTYAREKGASVIITVDCGIKSCEEVRKARHAGLDVIITDHHIPDTCIPEALAVINPKRSDSRYPYKDLAGVGVVFKLIQALAPEKTESVLDLAALGTVGDYVPLHGENRIIAFHGLKRLNTVQRPGIKALKKTAGIEGQSLNSTFLSFTIIPRLNAVGRLYHAGDAVELLTTHNRERAETIAFRLEAANKKRRLIEKEIFESALKKIDDFKTDNAFVLSSEGWHPGVIGIVASRIVEEFYRPTFLFSLENGLARGSARSIPGFHLYNGIDQCKDILLAYGGHSQAAGLRLSVKNVNFFRERINSIVDSMVSDEDFIPQIKIDAGVALNDIDFNVVKEIGKLEPFGSGNDEPVIGVKGLKVVEPRIVGQSHLKMRLRQNNITFGSIGFHMGKLFDSVASSPFVDAVFSLTIDEFRGYPEVQLNLKEIRPGKIS
jgi:single-stranded-DNA-specific exonuclease